MDRAPDIRAPPSRKASTIPATTQASANNYVRPAGQNQTTRITMRWHPGIRCATKETNDRPGRWLPTARKPAPHSRPAVAACMRSNSTFKYQHWVPVASARVFACPSDAVSCGLPCTGSPPTSWSKPGPCYHSVDRRLLVRLPGMVHRRGSRDRCCHPPPPRHSSPSQPCSPHPHR